MRYSFIFFICFYLSSGAQISSSDSLNSLLIKSGADSNRVKILCALGKASKGDTAFNYLFKAMVLAEKLHFKTGIALSHAYLGKYYYFDEKFSESLIHSIKALEISKSIGNNYIASYACLYIGFNHFQNEPETSLEYYSLCREYAKISGNKLMESYANSAIGNLYEKWEDGKTALSYFLLSLKIREQCGNAHELVSSLIETARGYNLTAQYDRSNELIFKALKIAEEKGNDEQNLIYLYQMIGYDYYGRLKDYKKALDYFLKSYNLVAKNNSFDANNLTSILPVAETYLKLGDYQNASEFYKSYIELSQANQKKLNKELFESQFVLKKEVEKERFLLKDSEILKQKVDIQKYENTRNIFIASTLLLLALLLFIYRNNRLKRISNTLLELKVKERTGQLAEINKVLREEVNEHILTEQKLNLSETKLIEINKELESFIYRASHDLRGPLASSRGLINLALNTQNTDETLKLIKLTDTSLGKLDAILGDLHEITLIRQGTVELKKIDIENTLKNLMESFKVYNNYSKIKFTINNLLHSDFYSDEILMKTILRNVLENAVKYSRSDIPNPFITILIKEEGTNYLIKISDNGIGISPEFYEKIFDVFFRATTSSIGSGLGLYIVKNAMNKLGAKIEVENSKLNEGTTFNLFFPKP